MFYNLKNKIKLIYLKRLWRSRNLHNDTYLDSCCNINEIHVGRFSYGKLNIYSSGCKNEGLTIGDFCSISSSSKFLLAGEHELTNFMTYPIKQKILHTDMDTVSKGKIVLDDDVWIGENVLILSGVHIAQGAVVAAGAVVVSDIPPYAIAAGVPAKVIKYRFSSEIIEKLLKIDFKKIDKNFIKINVDRLYKEPSISLKFDWLPIKK